MKLNHTMLKQRARVASPAAMITSGIVGIVVTNVLTGIASWRAGQKVYHEDMMVDPRDPELGKSDVYNRNLKLVWREYIPVATVGALTMTTLLTGIRMNNHRLGVATTAYADADRTYQRYREAVLNDIGSEREGMVRQKIALDQARTADRTADLKHLSLVDDQVICFEIYTGRHFVRSVEQLRKAVNDVNHQINHDLYVTLDQFYDAIELERTGNSGDVGWNSDKLLELEFSPYLMEDGRPAMAFDYNYLKPI